MAAGAAAGTSATGLGTLSIGLVAEVQQFVVNMRRAIEVLQFFRNEAMTLGKMVGGQFSQMAQQTQAMGGSIKGAMGAAGQQTQKFTGLLDQFGNKIKTTGATVTKTVDQVGKTAMTRGKQGLGAVLDFSAGIKQFLILNMRWFLIWRSFWAVWGGVQKAVMEFKDLMQETALALRTGVTELGSYVEKQMLTIRIQKEAIAATMKHSIANKDYIKSWYYLTTAGIAASDAFNFVNDSIKTAIALDEEHVTTVRLLTGLYNVFGETITDVETRQEKFQKISGILTATFREQDIELKDYADALPYVAAQWKQSGNSLEVLVAALGVMGTRFMRGSKSATSLTRSMSMLMRYPERFAKLTGMAFDPKKPLDFIGVIREMNKALADGSVTFGQMGFTAEEMGQLFKTLGLRGARAGAVLVDAFKDWEEQTQKNYDATFELVEQMARFAELTVPRQLEIMGNILQGWVEHMLMAATSTSDFAVALEKVNIVLRKVTPAFKAIGRVLKPFTSGLGKLIGTLAAVVLAWKGFGSAVAGQVVTTRMAFSKLLKTSAKAGGSFIVRLGLIALGIQSVLGTIQAIWSKANGTFEKEAKRHGADLMMTEKSTWDNILGYITSGLNAKELAMRMRTGKMRAAWRQYNRDLEADQKEAVENGWMTEEDANKHFYQLKVSYLQNVLGEQFTHEHKVQLAREYGFEVAKDQFEKEKNFYKDAWPKLLDELMKIRLDAFSYELWALKRHFEDLKKEWIANGKALNDLEKWYLEKRQHLIDEYADQRRQDYEESQLELRKMGEAKVKGYRKELRDAKKQTRRLKKDSALRWMDEIHARAAEIGASEKTVQKIGQIREKAHKGWIDEQQAFETIADGLYKDHYEGVLDIVEGYNLGIAKIEEDGSQRELDIVQEKANKIRKVEEGWIAEEVKIFNTRYGRHATEWEQELAGFMEHSAKRKEKIQAREKEIEKIYEGTGFERVATEKRVDKVLNDLREKDAEDFKAFLKENAAAYYLYTNEPFKAALAEMQNELRSFAEYQKEMWVGIGNSIKGAMGDAFYEILRGSKDMANNMTQIWLRLRDTILRYIAELAAKELWASILPKSETPSGPGVMDFFKAIIGGAGEGPDVGGGAGQPMPAGWDMGVAKPVPVTQDVTIVNVIDPNMVPAAMLRNREMVVNIINDDIMNRGATRSVIQNIRER